MSHEPEDHRNPPADSARPAPVPSPSGDRREADADSEGSVRAQSAGGTASEPGRYRATYAANYMDESPELLRWRADSLLDEMMMGGVDVSAADTAAPGRPPAQAPEPPSDGGARPARQPAPRLPGSAAVDDPGRPGQQETSQAYQAPPAHPVAQSEEADYGRPPRLGGQAHANGTDSAAPSRYEAAPGYETERAAEHPAYEARYAPAVEAASQQTRQPERVATDANGRMPSRGEQPAPQRDQFPLDEIGVRPPRLEPDRPATDATPRPLESVRSGESPADTTSSSGRRDRLYGLEQKYEQLRREQESTIRPVPPKTPTASTSPEPNATEPWPDPGEKWLDHDFGATPEPEIEPPPVDYGDYRAPRYDEPESAVRHDPAGFVNAMSVGGGKKRRSTLLPRMSEVSADALQQEITKLHADLADLLPVGHEAAERARHLLDKAYSILQSDPMRSAEVEYYMQQVRTIVQRQRQARDWSNLYRDRLHVYLMSWATFAAVVLMARFVFQVEIEAFLSGVLGLNPDGAVVHHFAAWLGTGMAGAFGGALGALYTMRQHAHSQYNFFDRKYGLRGLILPIIGLLVGWIGYFLFGLSYGLFGINPSANLVAGTLPALAAFVFGFSQESIYGTRG